MAYLIFCCKLKLQWTNYNRNGIQEETEYEEVFIDGTKIESMANRYTYHLPGAIFIIKRNTSEFFSRHILCK